MPNGLERRKRDTLIEALGQKAVGIEAPEARPVQSPAQTYSSPNQASS